MKETVHRLILQKSIFNNLSSPPINTYRKNLLNALEVIDKIDLVVFLLIIPKEGFKWMIKICIY